MATGRWLQSLRELGTLSTCPGKVRTAFVSGRGKKGRSKTCLSCTVSKQYGEGGHRVPQEMGWCGGAVLC